MRESYTPKDSSNALASSALSSHEKGDSHRAANPLVKQEIPVEEDDEPPIRPTYKDQYRNSTNGKLQEENIIHVATTNHNVVSSVLSEDIIVEKRPFDRDPTELAQYLHTSLTLGLDETEAQNRLKRYGKNILKGQGKVTIWTVLWRQVSNAMTVILLGALAIAFATEDYAEGSVIAGIYTYCFFVFLAYNSHRCCERWNRLFSGISR